MTPAEHAALPARERLAKTLLARIIGERGPTAYVPKHELYTYVTAAEDTINAQGAMLCSDLTDFTRLRTENATLRQLVEAALNLAQLEDRAAAQPHLDTIRQALERTA